MTLDEFRLEMTSYWQSADDEARSLKDPHVSLERMHALYRKFDASERRLADHVIGEWALSKDDGLRFDACALIDDLKISTAVPTLKKLVKCLAASRTPGAADEQEIVERIIAGLTG